MVRQRLDRASGLLADLAGAEKDIAGILLSLAAEDDPELAARRQELASQALAAAGQARDRARALREQAGSVAAGDGERPAG